MQISRNYRANKTFFQINRSVSLGFVFILLVALLGCVQPRQHVEVSANNILPVADNRNLPDVIKSLIQQSDEQFMNHNLSGSLATLERAVRINPRHAEVWSRMAQIYLQQGNIEQAKQHAKRSNSVIKNNTPLKAFNDNIITPTSAEHLN